MRCCVYISYSLLTIILLLTIIIGTSDISTKRTANKMYMPLQPKMKQTKKVFKFKYLIWIGL